jgi:hypothetical protein
MSKLGPAANRLEDSEPMGEVDNLDPDYRAWKDQKIRHALAQSQDRSAMIPADEVWSEFEA